MKVEIEDLTKVIAIMNSLNGVEEKKTCSCKNKDASPETDPLIGKLVLVRTYASGVHFGKLALNEGRVVELNDSRRLWRWEKAFTLNQVARDGVGPESMVSVPVASIRILDAIEIIPITNEAYNSLCSAEKDMR